MNAADWGRVARSFSEDQIDGADGVAYVRGRYAITLRPVGAPAPISDEGDFLEVWRRGPDGAWSLAEAMWNSRLPMGDQPG